MKAIIPIAFYATSQEISNGLANTLPAGSSIFVVDANGQPTGVEYKATGNSAPVESAGSIKNNFAGVATPLVTNDSSQGYSVGSRWIFGNESYLCTNAAIGAAVWIISSANTIAEIVNLQATLDAKAEKNVSVAMSAGYPTATTARSFTVAGQIFDISQIGEISFSGVDINGGYISDALAGQFITNTLKTSVANEITCWLGVVDSTLTKAVKARFVNASNGINITIIESAYWTGDVLASASWTTAGGEPAGKTAGDIASSNTANGYGLEALTLILDVMKGKSSVLHVHSGTYEPANANIQSHVTSAHAPSTAEQNVNADWNAVSGDAQVLNKPTIPAAVTVNNTLTSTSTTEALSAAQGKALQDGKQSILTSGTNIKTVDGQSLLGSGNITPTILLVTAPIAIRLTGSAGAGTNYPVKVTIGESSGSTGANFNLSATAGVFPASKNGTCSFLFWDASGAVPFWVEKVTGTTPNRVAHIWVAPLVSLSSGTPTVFLTTAATDSVRSSGNAVFTLFDDFDGTSLDATKWDISAMTGDSYSGSVLSFGGGNVARRLRTLNTVGDGFEVISLLRASDTSASYVAFGWDSGTVSEIYKYENGWNAAARINVAGATTNLTNDINNGAGVLQLVRIARAGGAGRFSSENPVNTLNSASGVPTVAIAPTIYNTYDNATEIDFVAIKKFVATEPIFLSAVQ